MSGDAVRCDVCCKVSDRKNHWRHITTHKKELIDMMIPQTILAVRKWEKPIVWIRQGDKDIWAYCMDCLVGTTCTSVRNSNINVWMDRHLHVCKADWSKYKHLYETKKTDITLLQIEQYQKMLEDKDKQLAERDAKLAEVLINTVNYQSDVATRQEEAKYKMDKKCWICNELLDHRRYGDHMSMHRTKLKPGFWIINNIDEYYRMVREGPIAHSPCGRIGFCVGCRELLPINQSAEHIHKCIVEGQSVTKWWKTGQDTTPFRPVLAKVEVNNPIVGNAEPTHAPPTTPTLSVQTDSTETLSRNEIHHDSSDSENAPAESEDDDWETRSDVSCSPMDYWDMDNADIRTIFGVLSDILEQGMECNVARKEYRETLKRLKPKKDSIGKPYKVLQAYILADYTKKDLGNFMSLQD